jgi:NAD(P)-dependent dehydrogenase (short-subunit alcohol dehydrogenase family)
VNNAGIFRINPFTKFTTEDFNALFATNLLGFLYIQLAVKQMLKQNSGNVVTISASLEMTGEILLVDGGARAGRW